MIAHVGLHVYAKYCPIPVRIERHMLGSKRWAYISLSPSTQLRLFQTVCVREKDCLAKKIKFPIIFQISGSLAQISVSGPRVSKCPYVSEVSFQSRPSVFHMYCVCSNQRLPKQAKSNRGVGAATSKGDDEKVVFSFYSGQDNLACVATTSQCFTQSVLVVTFSLKQALINVFNKQLKAIKPALCFTTTKLN